jgi:hypothetical protein
LSEEPASTSEPAQRTWNGGAIYRNIVLGVLAVSAVAVVGLLGTLTFYAITDHMADAAAAAEAKKTAIDKTQLAATVTRGVQNLLDNDDTTKDYHIQFQSDMVLFQVVKNGSEYKGLVTAKTPKGTDIPVQVTVYADNSGAMFYQIDPASDLRLTNTAEQEQPKSCNSYSGC